MAFRPTWCLVNETRTRQHIRGSLHIPRIFSDAASWTQLEDDCAVYHRLRGRRKTYFDRREHPTWPSVRDTIFQTIFHPSSPAIPQGRLLVAEKTFPHIVGHSAEFVNPSNPSSTMKLITITLKSYYLETLEVRLEDLDLRSCNIKIRNRDLLQELISCNEITSISGLVLRRKVSKLGWEKKV